MFLIVDRNDLAIDSWGTVSFENALGFMDFEHAAEALADGESEQDVIVEVNLRAELVITKSVEIREV